MRICEEAVVRGPVRSVWETLTATAGLELWDPAVGGSKTIRSDDEAPEWMVRRAPRAAGASAWWRGAWASISSGRWPTGSLPLKASPPHRMLRRAVQDHDAGHCLR